MPSLSSYCFKPKHGPEVAKRIIEHFCNKFLGYEHEGFYLYWREHNPDTKHRAVPEGWVEFCIDTDSGNLEGWSETCFWEEEVDGNDLTQHFFALLGDNFWYEDDDGNTTYTMYERELFEVIQALGEDGSRAIAWGGDRTAYVSYDDGSGERAIEHLDLLDFAMTVPIVKETVQDEQMKLAI